MSDYEILSIMLNIGLVIVTIIALCVKTRQKQTARSLHTWAVLTKHSEGNRRPVTPHHNFIISSGIGIVNESQIMVAAGREMGPIIGRISGFKMHYN